MDFRAALIDETEAFGELIRTADPAIPVPTCPEWTVRQLFRHVGRGNRWAAQIVAEQRDEPLDPREVPEGKPPDDLDAAIDWLNAGAQLVLDSVDAVGAHTQVWTFIGPRPAQWWIRRRVHEATVHRADAAIAVGADYRVSPSWPPTPSTNGWSESPPSRAPIRPRSTRARRCICTPPTTASEPRGNGRSPERTRGSRGH